VTKPRRTSVAAIAPMSGEYRVVVQKDYLKFSAAHFIAYKGFREPLHGHNYQVSVSISGAVGADGYVLDFGIVKQLTKEVCAELDERVLVPAESDCLRITRDETTVALTYEDGARFAFPASDVVLLPIVHASAEELATYVLRRLRAGLAAHAVRGLREIEVGVSEAPGQAAYCRERF
jgi:dihydroneopterin triphosphate aldolase (PTPS-III) / 6-pyruvoyltetrahydropterin synthase